MLSPDDTSDGGIDVIIIDGERELDEDEQEAVLAYLVGLGVFDEALGLPAPRDRSMPN
jgi:hypothetical protein